MADFFLPPDDAKTLGDINYMRKKIKVKRTFAKGASNPDGGESVREISAEDKFELGQTGRKSINSTNPTFATKSYSDVQVTPGKKLYINDNDNAPAAAPSFEPEASSEPEQSVPTPPSSSKNTRTSMDTFLNMAKNLGK